MQDLMKQWDVGDSIDLSILQCSLCDGKPDSHAHLFFKCKFSMQVWDLIMDLAGMQNVALKLDDIIEWLLLIAHKNSIKSIVARLVFAVATYFIWQERNNQIHGKETRRVNQIRDTIVKVVRMKLMTICFKKNLNVTLLLMLTNNGRVDGSGSNPGGGFENPGGGRETRGDGDRLEGPSGQLSFVDT
ncbi:hypothetical protein Tco_0404966 [Tanacetum coccineum]